MKIRKFLARNMPEALQQVRDDLGEQAVILSTRQLSRKNRFNLHDEALVEVTAAFDESAARGASPEQSERRVGVPSAGPAATAASAKNVDPGSFVARRYAWPRLETPVPTGNPVAKVPLKGGPSLPQGEAPADSSGRPPAASGQDELLQELRQLQESVRRIERRAGRALPMPGALGRLVERLQNVGLASGLIEELTGQLFAELPGAALDDRARIGERAAALLLQRMPACRAIKLSRNRQVIGFFGAAGTGKTTAAAKIAAGFTSKRQDRMLLISADDRRVGALDQVRTYTQTIGIPFEVAGEAEEIREVLARYHEMRLVLVDFSSCGPHDRKTRERQRRLAVAAGVDQLQVVIDARSSLDHMLDQVEASAVFDERRLLFTKLDEVLRTGALLSTAAASQLPTSYFTTGMAVPGQIEAGNLGRLVARTMGVSSVPPMRG